jgi:hypothetical protein
MNRNRCLNLLRRANAHLERFFARLSQQIKLHPNEEAELLLEVERTVCEVSALLDNGLEQSAEVVTRKEVARYQANLVRLRHELAGMQAGVFGCRARLFTQPKRVAAPDMEGAASRAVH